MYVCERTFNIFTAAEICLVCSQFCKFDGTLGKLERVYEEDRVWEWYHAINKLILFCIYTAEASLRINMWPSRLLMAHIQYTEKRSIFFHLNVELENRETERENYKKNDCCLFWITQWKIHIIISCLWLGDNCRWSASEYRKILPLQQPEFYLLLNLVRYLTCYFLLNFLFERELIQRVSRYTYSIFSLLPKQRQQTCKLSKNNIYKAWLLKATI